MVMPPLLALLAEGGLADAPPVGALADVHAATVINAPAAASAASAPEPLFTAISYSMGWNSQVMRDCPSASRQELQSVAVPQHQRRHQGRHAAEAYRSCQQLGRWGQSIMIRASRPKSKTADERTVMIEPYQALGLCPR
jgi:hypothetical protein